MPDELKVMSARAVKSAVSAVAQGFSEHAGCRVAFDFAPVGALEKKIVDGERADVVILSDAAIGKLDAAGHIDSGSRCVLGRTSIGVCVSEGAARPDIATPEAFRALLLSSPKISVSDVAVGGTAAVYLPKLFARMGIADELEPKLVRCAGGGDVAERVARGEAAIGITFISEILAIGGVTVIGALPAVYGNDTTYCGAVMKSAAMAEDARAFLKALVKPESALIWRRAGFDAGLSRA